MKIKILKFIIFTFATLLLSSSSWGQNIGKVPTQDDIIKNGAIRYFKRLPIEGWSRLLHLAGMGTFDLMLHQHRTKPQASPFRIFNSTVNRRTPSIDWSLDMQNNDSEYKNVVISDYGLCAGLTMTTRKLQLLAHFDPNNLEKQNVPAESNSAAWFQFMKKKIDDMMTYNRMSIIPNFTNIRELTAHPLLERYFKEHIVRQWELVNINFLQGLFQGFGGTARKMTKETTFKNIESLKLQLSLGINPIIFMSALSQKLFSKDAWIHVVQVVKIIRHSSAYTIQIWDPNLENPRYSESLVVNDNGQISFGDKDLAGIYPLTWDTFEIADMIEKNLDFCIARPGFCTTKPQVTDTLAPENSTIPTPPRTAPANPTGFQNSRSGR